MLVSSESLEESVKAFTDNENIIKQGYGQLQVYILCYRINIDNWSTSEYGKVDC